MLNDNLESGYISHVPDTQEEMNNAWVIHPWLNHVTKNVTYLNIN
jgi:hypothetical protein